MSFTILLPNISHIIVPLSAPLTVSLNSQRRWTCPSCLRSGMKRERASLDTSMESLDQVGHQNFKTHYKYCETLCPLYKCDRKCVVDVIFSMDSPNNSQAETGDKRRETRPLLFVFVLLFNCINAFSLIVYLVYISSGDSYSHGWSGHV